MDEEAYRVHVEEVARQAPVPNAEQLDFLRRVLDPSRLAGLAPAAVDSETEKGQTSTGAGAVAGSDPPPNRPSEVIGAQR